MAKLSQREADVLKRLQEKAEAPDAPESQKVLNINIDLGDEAQIKRGIDLGFFGSREELLEEEGGEGGGGGGESGNGETPPKRRGYFPNE